MFIMFKKTILLKLISYFIKLYLFLKAYPKKLTQHLTATIFDIIGKISPITPQIYIYTTKPF